MLEKLVTHNMERITMLFALASMCARLLRAERGTQFHKTGTPNRVAQKPLPRAATRRKKEESWWRKAVLQLSGCYCCGWGLEHMWKMPAQIGR